MTIKKTLELFILSTILFSCATTNPIETIVIEPEKTLYEIYISDAESGDEKAQVQIGICFEEGKGVSRNLDEAYKWYKMAAVKGNNEAYYRIGTFFEMGYSVEKSWDNALEWYLSSAATGFTPAIGRLIRFYEGNQEEQLPWIEKGVKNNDPYSYFKYAIILEESDKNKAFEYFRKSKETNDIQAQGILGTLSLSSQLVLFDKDTALSKIKAAAEMGDSRSQVFLGWLYEFGDFLEKDIKKAFELYENAAKDFEIFALYNLSRFYSEGLYVKTDIGLANQFFNQIPQDFYSPVLSDIITFAENRNSKEELIVLYRFLAAFNDIDAYYHLGLLSEPSQAYQWFWMASEAGHNQSMIELAKLLIDTDPVNAAAWLMVVENKLGKVDENFNSAQILEELTDSEKMEVSKIFTDLFF